jgi:hypothetical protein
MVRNLKMQSRSFENALSQHFGLIRRRFYENADFLKGGDE